MLIYPDTSFLVSLYIVQKNSDQATFHMQRLRESLVFTPLHRLELRNALRLAVFRRDIHSDHCHEALMAIESDIEQEILVETPVSWDEAFKEAERLSSYYTSTTGNRGMDILHVASALVLRAKRFLTFDDRQHALAKSTGLKLIV